MAVMKIQDTKKCMVFNEKNAKLKLTGLLLGGNGGPNCWRKDKEQCKNLKFVYVLINT